MMKKLLFLSVLFFVFSSVAQAQILRRVVRSASDQATESTTNRATKEVDKQVDKEVNKFFDSLLKEDTTKTNKAKTEKTQTQQNSGSSSSDEATPQSVSRLLGSLGMSSDVKRKPVYHFDSQITMIVETTDANGKKVPDMEYLTRFNNSNHDFGTFTIDDKGAKGAFIYDKENQVTLVLSDDKGKKSGFGATLNMEEMSKFAAENGTVEEDAKDAEVDCMKKTGKSQKINGYMCDEYRCEDEQGITTTWVTNDLDRSLNKLYGSSFMGDAYDRVGGVQGVAVVYHFKSKTDKSESKTTLKDFNLSKKSSFSTEGYQIMGLSLGGAATN